MSHAVKSIGEPVDIEHVIHIQRSDKLVEVEFGGGVIADSQNTLVLKESHCPYMGNASYAVK